MKLLFGTGNKMKYEMMKERLKELSDINANKYFSERNELDKKKHYEKLDNEYKELVKKYILGQ